MGRMPDDAAIADFVAFTGVDQQDAISYLTREPDVQKAVQNFYEAQERGSAAISSYAPPVWDESEMHAGKEYGPETNPQNSYTIHSADHMQTLGPDIFASTLSRPPSRVDVKLEDVEEAESRQGLLNSGLQSPKGESSSNFRAAMQEHYPEHQWGMVTTSHHILPDPDPKQRSRMLGSPAFLKPSVEANRIPGLLTIYQQIPLAREALLARDHVRAEYGTSKDWWQGDPLWTGGVVVSLDGSQPVEAPTPMIDEVQRWMAFLELTERAYGSCNTLTEEVERKCHTRGPEADASLLKFWLSECAEHGVNDNLRNVFSTFALEKTDGETTNESDLHMFLLKIENKTQPCSTLYDMLDDLVWATADPSTEITFRPGNVLTFDFNREYKSEKRTEWPAVWYADRYLVENKEKALAMLRELAQIKEEYHALQSQQDKLEFISPLSSQKTFPAKDLFKVVRRFLSGERPQSDELEDHRDGDILSGAAYHPLSDYTLMVKKLEDIADNISRKHDALEQVKLQLKSRKRIATDFLKGHSASPDDNPSYRYTLRGIALDQYTTFVLANPNTADDLLETRVDEWDWWRIAWDGQSENPIDLRKVTEADVLDAARDSDRLVAVYANDEAVVHTRQPVPTALKNFVRADNLHFTSELEHPELSNKRRLENTEWGWPRHQQKQWRSRSRSNSPDSMAANMDTEMNDRWDLIDETHPPSYSSTPPPVPPRTGDHRQAPALPVLQDTEDLMIMDDDVTAQQTGTINLMDDEIEHNQEMKEITPAALRTAPRFPLD